MPYDSCVLDSEVIVAMDDNMFRKYTVYHASIKLMAESAFCEEHVTTIIVC